MLNQSYNVPGLEDYIISTVRNAGPIRMYSEDPEFKRKSDRTTLNEIRGEGTILLVDDEEILLATGKGVLEVFGYKVYTKDDPMEALEFYQEKQDSIDLVLTDVIMPRMYGYELMSRIKDINKDVPVVIATGFSNEYTEEHAFRDGASGFIKKPYNMNVLGYMMHEILKHQKK